MEIKTLALQNFFSFQNASINLAGRGLCLVEGINKDSGGSNGSGKSTLFESILFCLFGKTTRYGSSNTKVSRNRKGETQVYIELSTEQATVKVYRHREHSTYGNKLLVYSNDTDLTKGSDTETQKVLEDIIQMDYATFVAAVMFPQNTKGFTSLNDAGQKAVLESILGVERFSLAHERAKLKHSDLQKRANSLRASIQEITNSLGNKHVALLRLLNSEGEFEKKKQEDIARLEKELEELTSKEPKIDPQIEAEIESLSKQVDATSAGQAERLRGQIASRISELERQHAELQGGLAAQRRAIKNVDQEPPKPQFSLHYYEGEYQRHSEASKKVTGELYLAELELKQFDAPPDAVPSTRRCPTCGQELSEQARAHVHGSSTEKRLRATGQVKQLAQIKREVDAELQTAEDLYYGAKAYEEWEESALILNEIKNGEARLAVLEPQIEAHKKQLIELDEILHSSRDKVEKLNKLSTLLLNLKNQHIQWLQNVDSKKSSLDQKRSTSSPFTALIAAEREDIAKHTGLLEARSALSDEVEKQLSMLEFWTVGFSKSGVRGILLDQATPFLNQRAQHYANLLSEDLKIQFSTQTRIGSGELREKFNIEASSRFGSPEFSGLSGGEAKRVDIPVLLALGDLSASRASAPVELRLIDELFDDLDAIGCEAVIRLLNTEIVTRAKTILVTTHRDDLSQFFENRITIIKENGISRIL